MSALCNLSRKKSREVAASLPGRSPRRRCFTLYITMEVEPRIAKQYNATTVAVAKITGERGWRVDKKREGSLRRFFLADQKIENSWKKCVLGHLIARAISYCLLPDTHYNYGPPKMPLKLAV